MKSVLLVNPVFPASFWSLSEMMCMGGKKALLPPLGLLTVAALLPTDWKFRLADLNVRDLTEKDWDFAQVVMLTGMIAQRASLLSLIVEAKSRGKTVVVGGPFASSTPDDVLAAGCDYLIQGECEDVVADLVAALEAGHGTATFHRGSKPELSTSPIPRFDLLNLDDYDSLSVQTSRGCPFACEFCDIISLFGRVPRHKQPAQVMAELETIHRLGWRGTIFFADDNFIGNRSQAVALLELLIPWHKERGEPFDFLTQASVNLGQDKALIDLMTAANFAHVFVGIESPDEAVLTATFKHQNVSNPLLESIRNINANGLSVIGSFILGFDAEKSGAGQRIQAFVEAADLPIALVNVLQALPNTKLWDRLREEHRLRESHGERGNWEFSMNFRPVRPVEEILNELVTALDTLHDPARYLSRSLRSILGMRPTRSAMSSEKASAGSSPPPVVLRKYKPADMKRFAHLVLRQGLKSPARWQFWKQLFLVWRLNPSRMKRYFFLLAMGEDVFSFVRMTRKRAKAYLEGSRSREFQKGAEPHV